MSHSRVKKPIPHGLRQSLAFSKTDCDNINIPESFAGLQVKDWAQIEKLAEAAAEDATLSRKPKPDSAHAQILQIFKRIQDKHSAFPAMRLYCEDVTKFLKTRQTKETFREKFLSAFNMREMGNLKKDVEQEATKNAYKATLIGVKRYGSVMDDELDKISTRKRAASTVEVLHNESKRQSRTEMEQPADELFIISTIGKAARSLHNRKQAGEELSSADKKVMSAGLSSVLDLVDATELGQKALFDMEFWTKIEKHFSQKFIVKESRIESVSRNLGTIWQLVATFCNDENSVDKARKYILKMQLGNITKLEQKMLSIFSLILDLLDDHSFMLDVATANKATETDYLTRIWAPIFDFLFSAGNNVVRVKSGESVSEHSAAAKRLSYNEEGNVVAFKIDIRFVVDWKDKEYDLAAGELSKMFPNDQKLFGDEEKLMREGKDVVDGLVSVYNGKCAESDVVGWVLQLSGASGELSSVHLAYPGLYVAVPQRKLVMPKCISSMRDFLKTVEALLLFKSEVEQSAQHVRESLQNLEDRRISMGSRFDRTPISVQGCIKASWTRPTYYTPPSTSTTVDIAPLEASLGLFPEIVPNSGGHTVERHEFVVPTDDFGWGKTTEGYWFNTALNMRQDDDPYA